MRSALEWAQVWSMAAGGVPQREIARRLGLNRRTVARLAGSDEPPSYRRARAGSKLDPLEPVLRRLVEEWPQIKAPRATEILRDEYGFQGSVDVVKRRLRVLRPALVRPAQRTGYRPGQVMQLDWAKRTDLKQGPLSVTSAIGRGSPVAGSVSSTPRAAGR